MPESYSLLAEPLLGVRLPGGKRTRATLPELLAHLSGDGVEACTALQAHQAQAWHCFLVQLAALALLAEGKSKPPRRAGDWKSLLLGLSGGSEQAWALLVADLRKPAFLQPPVPEQSLAGFKVRLRTPDALDVLITSKNHDVKAARMYRAAPEHWVYALVSLQTTQGYSGVGNYGIARMNGGAGSRPMVGFVPSLDPGARFRRDLGVLLDCHEVVAEQHGYRCKKILLWLEPWDGSKTLPLRDLHPFSIEICRRIRLVDDGRIEAVFAGSKTTRVEAKDTLGDVGDPWTPVHTATKKSLTVAARGFHYQLTQALLFGADYLPPPAQQLAKGDPENLVFHASVLARGMGTTDGLHERYLPIPPKIRLRLAIAAERNRLATMAKERVDAVARASRKVLRPALLVLLQSAPEKLNNDDDRTARWLARLDEEVDSAFFEHLWEDADLAAEEARRRWERTVLELAKAVLEEAIREAPVAAVRRYRAEAAAERVFDGCARKHLPDAFSESEPDDQEATP